MDKSPTTTTTRSIKKRERASVWYHSNFFKYTVGMILVLTIFLLVYQLAFLVSPILNFISILFLPIVISILFYYLLRPIIHFLEKYGIPRTVAIIIVYAIIAFLGILFLAYIVPTLAEQITAIANTSVTTLETLRQKYQQLAVDTWHINLDYEIEQRFINFLQSATKILSQNILDLLGIITRVAAILVVIPFIVFYLLKDDHDFASSFLKPFPEDFTREVKKILTNIDTTLSSYITGLIIVSGSLGTLLFFAYLIIGLNYALILSLIAMVCTTIPFLGPFLAITPALLVGLSESPFMTLKVAIVFIIIQQLESNVISPQILGQRLNIHPLTIILLLLAAGSLYGLLGLILATPGYAVCKVLAQNLYKIYRLRYPKIQETLAKEG